MRFIDLTGMKFGRLTVLEYAGKDKRGRSLWKCRCDCGAVKIVQGYLLTHGITQSCGCLSAELASKRRKKHGMTRTNLYKSYYEMKRRCLNPNADRYDDYGGRGIKVCERWLKFENFYEDVSKLEHFGEKGYTLDRINDDGDYCPENVRWATPKQQANNTRRNVIVEYQGELMTLSQAAELSGVQVATLWARIQRGDTGDRLFRPVKK